MTGGGGGGEKKNKKKKPKSTLQFFISTSLSPYENRTAANYSEKWLKNTYHLSASPHAGWARGEHLGTPGVWYCCNQYGTITLSKSHSLEVAATSSVMVCSSGASTSMAESLRAGSAGISSASLSDHWIVNRNIPRSNITWFYCTVPYTLIYVYMLYST